MGVVRTKQKSQTTPEERPVMAKHAHELLQGKYADLTGSDEKKCGNKALLEDVRILMKWDYAPGGKFLFDELRRYRIALAEAPKEEKPRRRRAPGPEFPAQPPKRRAKKKLVPAPAKPEPLAERNLDCEPVDATPSASSELDQFQALLERADKARKGETESRVKSDPRPKACKMRRVGDVEWRTFASRTDAAAAFPGISPEDVTKLCNKKAGPALLAKGLEARDACEGASMSKAESYASVLHAGGFSFVISDVRSDADALRIIKRGEWKVVDLPPPQSWADALKSMGEFNESQLRNFAAATAEAEAARVLQTSTANLTGPGRLAQILSRRAAAAAGARETEEAFDELVVEEIFDPEEGLRAIKVHEDNVEIFLKDKDHKFRDDEEVLVKYKGKWVILKAGPWPKRYAFGSPGGALRVAPARATRGTIGETVATLRRMEVGDAVIMTSEAADGTEDWAHGGVDSLWALTANPREKPKDHVRGREFDPVAVLRDIGLSLLRETPATQDNGEPLDGGFSLGKFALDAAIGTWGEFATESDRLRDRLFMTTPEDRRLDDEGAVASYRRNVAGASEPGTVALVLSAVHRATGPSRHWTALHNFLSREGFPIYAELMRRGNIHCVPLEFLAYRDPTKGGPFHLDSATVLLLSSGGQTSATMAEA